ncbi:variant erythrocyte surface antigen-1 family protein [Babesia caballi]|uniref:Variant erythrocyte surface antigen-1 family protein n=1 Tax=Babesia caballi TaxID=5871 RepID=A0AAV4LX92_BABCB|nr:variant erythrocyte surface antigen-1 family protein [Babesia caballi]
MFSRPTAKPAPNNKTEVLGREPEGLLREPKNLKEAIDWMLRATNKDGCQGQPNSGLAIVKITEQLKRLLENSNGKVIEDFKKIAKEYESGTRAYLSRCYLTDLAVHLGKGLATFIGYDPNGTGVILADQGLGKAGKEGYASSYPLTGSAETLAEPTTVRADLYAENFLKAVLIIFRDLTYLYWMCSLDSAQGGWMTLRIDGNKNADWAPLVESAALKEYLANVGYNDVNKLNVSYVEKSKRSTDTEKTHYHRGSTISGRLRTAFPELGNTSEPSESYEGFINDLKGKVLEKMNKDIPWPNDGSCDPDKSPLTKTYAVVSAYLEATQSSGVTKAVLKTIGITAVASGLGGAAYVTGGFGFYPAIASFLASAF